jgi:hypothetical protein
MNFCNAKHVLAAALIGVALGGANSKALAGIDDYEFQLVQSAIKTGDAAIVAVRLVDKRSGKVVPDAVIFTQRIDMAPDGMEAMTAPVEALPSDEPGIYRFKTNLIMEGGWRFSIAAKIQGEAETVESRLEFKATQ